MNKPFNFSRCLVLSILFVLLVFTSCTKSASQKVAATSESSEEKILNLGIWSNYLNPDVIKSFEAKTGIQVRVSNYSSNEELLGKLQAGGSLFDVVVPSDYMVFAMIQLGLLHPLDTAQLSEIKNIDARFMKKSYDRENKYSLPYVWGTTGIAVNRKLYKGPMKGWKDLFTRAELKGKYTVLDDGREAIGAVIKMQGGSLNTKNEADLAKAKAFWLQNKKNVKAFTSETKAQLISGETMVAHVFSSDALQAKKETGGAIEYIIPEEGGTFWQDNLVVLSAAPHKKNAHLFINYMLEGNSSLFTTQKLFLATTNLQTFKLLPSEWSGDALLFPPDSVIQRLEMMEDLGEFMKKYDRAWTEIKAGS